MNKKILMLLVTVLAVAMLATSVMAKPTQGQKVAVSLIFNFPVVSQIIVDEWFSNGVAHRNVETTFNVDLMITGGDTLYGTAFIERKSVMVFPKGKDTGKVNLVDYYVFDFGDGGFEGNGKVMLDGFNPMATPPWEDVRGQGLFHGTGDFEGQTLYIKLPWGTTPWTGTWLRYDG